MSQEVSRSNQSSSGGSIKNNQGFTLEWTLGAQFSQTIKSDNHLTEGFQQGDFKKVKIVEVSQRKELDASHDNLNTIIEKPSLQVSVFPNPTKESLFLNIKHDNIQGAIINVLDSNGNVILIQNIEPGDAKQIDIKGISILPAGHYIIQVFSPTSSQFISFVKVN